MQQPSAFGSGQVDDEVFKVQLMSVVSTFQQLIQNPRFMEFMQTLAMLPKANEQVQTSIFWS